MLGSGLGSTWFRIGPSCKNVIFHTDFAWFLAWFHLVPTWFQFV
jgi:hypothetical protein